MRTGNKPVPILLLLNVLVLLSCSSSDQKPTETNKLVEDTLLAEEYLTAYVVVADTGKNYEKLKDLMVKLNHESSIKIDTMGRADFHREGHSEKTIALVSGIYATEQEATAAVARIQKYAPNTTMLKSQIYMGCMH